MMSYPFGAGGDQGPGGANQELTALGGGTGYVGEFGSAGFQGLEDLFHEFDLRLVMTARPSAATARPARRPRVRLGPR